MKNNQVLGFKWGIVSVLATVLGVVTVGITPVMTASPVAASTVKTQGKYPTAKYRAHNAKVMIKPAYQNSNKKAYQVTNGTPSRNQRVNLKAKYRLSQLDYLTVDHQASINHSLYYHFTTTSGQNGWIWHGYTQKTNLKYVAQTPRKFSDQVVVRSQYRQKSSKQYVYDLAVHEGRTNLQVKYSLRGFNHFKVDQKMMVGHTWYYHVTSPKKYTGWVRKVYTQPYIPKYPVKNIKTLKQTVYVKSKYRTKSNKKKIFDFDVIHNHTNFKFKYYVHQFTRFTVDKRMTVNNSMYYHVKSPKGYTGWIWHGYTTTKKPVTSADKVVLNNYMTKEIQDIMDSYHLRGKVLVINGNKSNRDTEGFGYANYSSRITNSKANVVYQGASLQKAMTGAMMVQLITESQKTSRRITQNTPVSRWFPNLTGGSKITVGNLLTQTSGITDNRSEVDPGYRLSEQQAINNTVQRINNTGLASKTFHYNNDNYILLAGIIRAYTGQSYSYNLQKRIIQPLGLKNTFMWDAVSSKNVKAHSYQYSGGNYRNDTVPNDNVLSYIPGAGNMYTTPDDYYKFEQGLQNGKILNYDDYTYLTNINTKSSNGYSGGMYIRHSGNLKVVYGTLTKNHMGNWVQLTKTNGQGIILFANQSNNAADVKQAGYDILSKFSNQFDRR